MGCTFGASERNILPGLNNRFPDTLRISGLRRLAKWLASGNVLRKSVCQGRGVGSADSSPPAQPQTSRPHQRRSQPQQEYRRWLRHQLERKSVQDRIMVAK